MRKVKHLWSEHFKQYWHMFILKCQPAEHWSENSKDIYFQNAAAVHLNPSKWQKERFTGGMLIVWYTLNGEAKSLPIQCPR